MTHCDPGGAERGDERERGGKEMMRERYDDSNSEGGEMFQGKSIRANGVDINTDSIIYRRSVDGAPDRLT